MGRCNHVQGGWEFALTSPIQVCDSEKPQKFDLTRSYFNNSSVPEYRDFECIVIISLPAEGLNLSQLFIQV